MKPQTIISGIILSLVIGLFTSPISGFGQCLDCNRSGNDISFLADDATFNLSNTGDLNTLGGQNVTINGDFNFGYGGGNNLTEIRFANYSFAFGREASVVDIVAGGFAFGDTAEVLNESDFSLAFGQNVSVDNESNHSFAFGANQTFVDNNSPYSFAFGDQVQIFDGAEYAFGFGREIEVVQPDQFVAGWGGDINFRANSDGAIVNPNLGVRNNANVENHATIGNTLEVEGNGSPATIQTQGNRYIGFSSNNPTAPYFFTETSKSPTGFSGGQGKANIVQDLGGFPFISSGNKWISIGERPPDNNDNQIAYGYAATWDNFAGNFFMDDVNQNGTKDLTISFQDAGASDPDNATNRMRFIARDGNKIFQSSAFNELMSLEPTGEVGIGDYRNSTQQANLEVKAETQGNGDPVFQVRKNASASGRGDLVMTANDDGQVGIGLNNPSAQLEITSGSPLKPGGGPWISSSDRRLKKNIKNYKDGLEELMEIRPVWYQYNSKMKHVDLNEKHVGVIAQETEGVAPYMVEKSYKVDGKEYYSLNSTAFTYMLINAVQKHEKQLQEEKAQNQSLKEKVEKQQEQIDQLRQDMNRLADQGNGNANKFKKSGDENLNKRTVSIGEDNNAKQAMLLQNRPNPYSGETVIPYYLPKDFESANLLITNTNGQVIKRVTLKQAGKGELTLRTEGLNAGQYLYSLIVDGRKIQTRKMVLSKK